MNLRLLDEAKQEMRESALWYEDKRAGLGDQFLDTIQHGFELIEEHPHRYMRIETTDENREVRRYVVKRFPFLIIYEVLSTEVLVVAVAHAKRKPRYWESRLT